jgi:hypothetical protein
VAAAGPSRIAAQMELACEENSPEKSLPDHSLEKEFLRFGAFLDNMAGNKPGLEKQKSLVAEDDPPPDLSEGGIDEMGI